MTDRTQTIRPTCSKILYHYWLWLVLPVHGSFKRPVSFYITNFALGDLYFYLFLIPSCVFITLPLGQIVSCYITLHVLFVSYEISIFHFRAGDKVSCLFCGFTFCFNNIYEYVVFSSPEAFGSQVSLKYSI